MQPEFDMLPGVLDKQSYDIYMDDKMDDHTLLYRRIRANRFVVILFSNYKSAP